MNALNRSVLTFKERYSLILVELSEKNKLIEHNGQSNFH